LLTQQDDVGQTFAAISEHHRQPVNTTPGSCTERRRRVGAVLPGKRAASRTDSVSPPHYRRPG
jgi:hypothetical protein